MAAINPTAVDTVRPRAFGNEELYRGIELGLPPVQHGTVDVTAAAEASEDLILAPGVGKRLLIIDVVGGPTSGASTNQRPAMLLSGTDNLIPINLPAQNATGAQTAPVMPVRRLLPDNTKLAIKNTGAAASTALAHTIAIRYAVVVGV